MSKKSKKKRIKLSSIIGLIYLIFYGITFGYIYKENILPSKYFLIAGGVTLLISIILISILWNKKRKKIGKFFASIICIILMIVYGLGVFYVNNTMDFLNNIKAISANYEEFYVVVNKESDYKKLADINDEYVFVKQSNDEVFTSAQDKLDKKIDVEYKEVDNLSALAEKVEDEEIIFLSSSNYKLLSEDEYKLDEISKIIYKVKVKSDMNSVSKDVNITKEAFNIYISGVDNTDEITNVSRSDVNMVVTVNPHTNKILLTSIPRDYYVTLHSSGKKDKLTHAGMYGIDESIMTIEDLLDIDINYYVRVNFNTVIDLVDVIGGITVYSEYTFRTSGMEKSYSFVKGYNEMDGRRALAYARERHSFADGDRQRVKNQQDVLTAIIDKMTSSKTLLTKYTSILTTLEKTFQTNMDEEEIKALIKYQLDDMPSWSIERYSLDGTDSTNVTYSFGNQMLYVMEPKVETVNEAKNMIDEISEDETETE